MVFNDKYNIYIYDCKKKNFTKIKKNTLVNSKIKFKIVNFSYCLDKNKQAIQIVDICNPRDIKIFSYSNRNLILLPLFSNNDFIYNDNNEEICLFQFDLNQSKSCGLFFFICKTRKIYYTWK